MLLVIDVGNTNTVLGVFEGDTLLHHWRVWTDREKTSDEYGILLRNLYDALANAGIRQVSQDNGHSRIYRKDWRSQGDGRG